MQVKLTPLSRVFLAGIREFFMQKVEDAGDPRAKYGSERLRSTSIDELSRYFHLPPGEIAGRLLRLRDEGGINTLSISNDGEVTFSDGSGVKKCSDYRSRLKDAGFVSVTCWLTPEQAEIVKEWHRFNVSNRDHGPEIVSAWRDFLARHGADLESRHVCS